MKKRILVARIVVIILALAMIVPIALSALGPVNAQTPEKPDYEVVKVLDDADYRGKTLYEEDAFGVLQEMECIDGVYYHLDGTAASMVDETTGNLLIFG